MVTLTLWRVLAAMVDFIMVYVLIGDRVGARQGYVLDTDLNLLPVGVAGELYLGGLLAWGFWIDRVPLLSVSCSILIVLASVCTVLVTACALVLMVSWNIWVGWISRSSCAVFALRSAKSRWR